MLRATALLYSGRPNPSWTISSVKAPQVEASLAGLEEIAPAPAPFPGLGYSGIVLVDSRTGVEWVLAAGVAHAGGRRFRDQGRHVEKLLLEDGARETGADLLAHWTED
jgi:hypothetical protein